MGRVETDFSALKIQISEFLSSRFIVMDRFKALTYPSCLLV